MPFNPDLSTIQEATFSNSEYFDSASSSPVKSSVASEINQNLKRSILSGLNSIRRLQNNPLYEEDSTIIEDESFFDEQDDVRRSCPDVGGEQMIHSNLPTQNIRYDELPLLVEPSVNEMPSFNANSGNQIDEIKVGGKGTYTFEMEPMEQPRNTVQSTKTTQKRSFLKRGQGKNCLQKFPTEPNTKSAVKQKLKPVNSKASKNSKVPNVKMPKSSNHQKIGKENKMPKSSVPKPSKNILNSKTVNRVTSSSMYDQEPEDSFNVSIQNEKQANEQLQSKPGIHNYHFQAF